MFDTVELILDVLGNPVFVLPVDPGADDCAITVREGFIEFFSARKKIGHVEEIPVELVVMLTQLDKVGIIAWDDSKKLRGPLRLTHIADVYDDREVPA